MKKTITLVFLVFLLFLSFITPQSINAQFIPRFDCEWISGTPGFCVPNASTETCSASGLCVNNSSCSHVLPDSCNNDVGNDCVPCPTPGPGTVECERVFTGCRLVSGSYNCASGYDFNCINLPDTVCIGTHTCSENPPPNTDPGTTECVWGGIPGGSQGCATTFGGKNCNPGWTFNCHLLSESECTGVHSCVAPGDQPGSGGSAGIGTFEVCDMIPNNTQAGRCRSCLGVNGVWTGLGCLKYDAENLIPTLLSLAIGIAGGMAFLLMIYGAFMLSTSGGNPESAQKGKDIIGGAIAGLIFIIFSVVLLNLIGVDILKIPGF